MKKAASKKERDHMDRVASLGCIACKNLGFGHSKPLIHHIRTLNGQRITRNHLLVLPLCFSHHSADSENGFHHGSRTWQTIHGTEAQLLEEVKALLELYTEDAS